MKKLWAVCMVCYVPAVSAGDWSSQALLQGTYTTYQGSDTRNSALSGGVLASLDYLEDAGLSLGANQLVLDMTSGYPITQTSYFASARYHQYLDILSGKLTYQLNWYQDDLSNELTYQSNSTVIAPQLSYVNYSNSFYMDVGYAYSTYKEGFTVEQWTPTVGFALNHGADWLQSRAYGIQVKSDRTTQTRDPVYAGELKWTHWFAPSAWLKTMSASVLFGERMYAVDGDAAAVYTLPDLQQGGGTLGVTFALFGSMQSSLSLGYDKYLNQFTKDAYTAQYAYFNVSQSW